jgi:hypothetical protein
MSKKDGRNYCSNNTIVIATSSLTFAIVFGSTTLLHNFLITQFKRMITILQPLAIKCHMHKGNMSYIMT